MGYDLKDTDVSQQRRDKLKELVSMPLHRKIAHAISVIEKFVMQQGGVANVYVSFSGGKDSTVVLDLVRKLHPEIPAVFCDTGLEYPEVREFVKTIDNVEWLKPKMTFKDVIETYGYPAISKEVSQQIWEALTLNPECKTVEKRKQQIAKKWQPFIQDKNAPQLSHRCCDILKKNPAKVYERRTGRMPITGVMAAESRLRKQHWLRHGCISFTAKRTQCKPLSIFTEEDIWEYINKTGIKICPVYDSPLIDRTGCIFCLFGQHRDNGKKFRHLKETHPKLFTYCMETLKMKEVMDFMTENCKCSFSEIE